MSMKGSDLGDKYINKSKNNVNAVHEGSDLGDKFINTSKKNENAVHEGQ